MRLVHPLAIARGKGSAGSGVEHWWVQRLTAVALVPLVVWFVAVMSRLAGATYAETLNWLSDPLNATLMIAFVLAMLHHAQLGLQVIIEDYLHNPWLEYAALIAVKLIAALAAILAVISILRVLFGG